MDNINFGKRFLPWGQLRVGERVIAYNPHAHSIAREGSLGEIAPQGEISIRITDYYLGCFQRGALFALREEIKEEAIVEIKNSHSIRGETEVNYSKRSEKKGGV